MKKYIYYIVTLFFLQAVVGACTDTEIYDTSDNSKGSQLKIVLNVPVDNARTRGLVHGPDEDPTTSESAINDVYVLAFNKANNKYLGKFQPSMSNNTLIASIDIEKIGTDEITALVLTNLNSLENGSELVNKINQLTTGQTKEQLLKSLVYTFNNIWSVNERPLPMWGETDITPVKESTVTGTVNLYRAVSKINVTFNGGKQQLAGDNKTEIFKLKSVRVYYARTSGLAGSLHAPIANKEGGSDLIDTPSIPDEVNYFPRYKEDGTPNNLLFETTSEDGDYAIENQIYVPESDQDQTDEPMCLVIGGYYMGSDKETFYRVDFKQGNKGSEYYDAIRNHIYNFNINTVTRPGTDEPDPALDHVVVGMDVTITDWTTEWMQGIGGQYTLKVSTGGFVFASDNTSNNEITVETTHNEGWDITDQSGDWFSLKKEGEKVIVTPKAKNAGGQRRGSFVITSGNLRKEIIVRQQGKGTANCYVVSDKIVNGEYQHILHDLIVTVKGNGEEGIVADGHPFKDSNPYLEPDDVKLIWETAKGLINIKTTEEGKAFINENGIIQYTVDLSKQNQDILKDDKNQLGGNALIGAFKDGEVIWTWHIWVCPDFDNSNDLDGEITTEELEAHTQTWATNGTTDGYDFLDRYLGALSNKPGLASLGLLYQWGRKDPFIGAASISENQSQNRMYTDNLSGYEWNNSASNISITESIKKPTTLINGTIADDDDYKFLWGTDKGFSDIRDAGNKTIYDPCPIGYRVPPVSAIVFKNGSTTSEETNYEYNNTYWPNTSTYISPQDAESYGFWVNYRNSTIRPKLDEYKDGKNPTSIDGATWLPLAGVYDGDINKFALVDGNNSLTVNSIIWTNSSVTVNKNGTIRPGALFLHGTEPEPKNYRNGRHLHRLIENENNLYAKKTHAGSVRCIRDSKSSIHNAIQVPDEIVLDYKEGSTVSGYLTSISESWEVTDPGAKWVVMTPDQGTSGSQQVIKFTATLENTSYSAQHAEIKIKFSDNTVRSIKVTQKGKPEPTVPSPINLAYSAGATANGSITAGESWQISDWGGAQDWLEITPNSGNAGGTLTFKAKTANPSYTDKRTAIIKVTFGGNFEKPITVTQAVKPEPKVTNSITLTYNAGASKTGNISNCVDNWEVSDWGGAQDWLEIDPSSGTGNKTLTFRAKTTNPSYTDNHRIATIKVTFGGNFEKPITVTQNQKTAPTLPSNVTLGYRSGVSTTGYLTSVADSWEVIDINWQGATSEWFTLSPKNAAANSSRQPISFTTTEENPNYSSREATVTVRFGSDYTKTFTVKQNKKPTPISVSGGTGLTFAGYNSLFGNSINPSSKSVTISGDEEWTATATSDSGKNDWLYIADNWGPFDNSSTTISSTSSRTLYIKPQKNTDRNAKTRTGKITLTGQETGTKITITVTQGTNKE
ncbi:BACON domain-containing protein [Bacteroides bouchesdurhonensis]|uniref:BACON domain-containing protein n=1 Tax=Bacteroides bouchesdurhonensis TaxID=1841855 RepID=UPI0011DDE130|nr:BACON domain-containing carbohydrate-binding protein [Bacteroides bouchesdurhonensis]